MYVYLYVVLYIHILIQIHVYICIYIYMYVCICLHLQISAQMPEVLATAAAYGVTGLVAFLLWLGFVAVAQLEEVGATLGRRPLQLL